MDTIYYSRISLSGWVFAAFCILIIWADGGAAWYSLEKLLSSPQLESSSPLILAVFGAVVGLGGPPAFGFILEKLGYFCVFIFRRSHRSFPGTYDLLGYYLDQGGFGAENCPKGRAWGLRESEVFGITASGLFHVCFYSFADEKLLDWTRRRRGQFYASISSALAIFLAHLVCRFVLGAYSWGVILLSVVISAFLLFNAYREEAIHRMVVKSWIETEGRALIAEKLSSAKWSLHLAASGARSQNPDPQPEVTANAAPHP